MELSVLAVVIMLVLLCHFLRMDIRSLHHTGLMLTPEEQELFIIVRQLILVSLLEQPAK